MLQEIRLFYYKQQNNFHKYYYLKSIIDTSLLSFEAKP